MNRVSENHLEKTTDIEMIETGQVCMQEIDNSMDLKTFHFQDQKRQRQVTPRDEATERSKRERDKL